MNDIEFNTIVTDAYTDGVIGRSARNYLLGKLLAAELDPTVEKLEAKTMGDISLALARGGFVDSMEVTNTDGSPVETTGLVGGCTVGGSAPEQDDFDVALKSFVEALQEKSNAYYDKTYPNTPMLKARIIIDSKGRKYKRIVKTDADGTHASVHCFVEVATGNIWKAAGWKGPAKNFPRGNIYNDDPTKGTSVYGTC